LVISILVPLYNEQEFVGTILERAITAPLPPGYAREIIVVDDASTDDSAAAVLDVALRFPDAIRLVRFSRNRGKGAAVRRAIEEARGEFCIIQDADLEYNPNDYPQLLQPLVDGVADAVYGSRFAAGARRRALSFRHSLANHLLTGLSNVVSGLNLTDMETGYKAFRTSLAKSIPLRSDRFGFEPEITIKLAKRHARVYEVPISYEGRTYEEGKKIGLADAVQTVWTIFRFGLTSDLYTDPGAEILDAFSVAPRFNQWMADAIRPFLGRRVLEIGAGMGNLTRPLSLGRDRYVASDVDSRHLARLKSTLKHRSNIEIHSGDVSQSESFEEFHGSMESVVCLNVMEHVDDDLACARNMYGALAGGGRAIVLVPHGLCAFGSLDAVLGHRRRYTRESLQDVLERGGFVVERIIAFNRISWPAWYLQGKLLRRSRISRLSLRLFDASVFLWRRLDGFLPLPPISLIAIARKPASARSGSDVADAHPAPTATPPVADNSAEVSDSLGRRDRAPK
jgi:glycosyltransferase involved in cell wall biosynthesis